MSEIRDKVREQACQIIVLGVSEDSTTVEIANKILSIPEIAIVDRKAELTIPSYLANTSERNGAVRMKNKMLEESWAKEEQ